MSTNDFKGRFILLEDMNAMIDFISTALDRIEACSGSRLRWINQKGIECSGVNSLYVYDENRRQKLC